MYIRNSFRKLDFAGRPALNSVCVRTDVKREPIKLARKPAKEVASIFRAINHVKHKVAVLHKRQVVVDHNSAKKTITRSEYPAKRIKTKQIMMNVIFIVGELICNNFAT